jgi:hypothetical protein
LNVRWLIATLVAALAVAFLYFGVVQPLLSPFPPATGRSGDAPAVPLAVESSKMVPTRAQETPSNLPAAVVSAESVRVPTSLAPIPPKPPHHRTTKSMGKFARRQFVAAVDGLGARLANCPDRDIQRGFGKSPLEGELTDQLTMLVLEVAMHGGTMEVVDVSQQSNGSLSAAFVTCAQKMLRGEVVPAPSGRDRKQYAIFLGPATIEIPDGPAIK